MAYLSSKCSEENGRHLSGGMSGGMSYIWPWLRTQKLLASLQSLRHFVYASRNRIQIDGDFFSAGTV